MLGPSLGPLVSRNRNLGTSRDPEGSVQTRLYAAFAGFLRRLVCSLVNAKRSEICRFVFSAVSRQSKKSVQVLFNFFPADEFSDFAMIGSESGGIAIHEPVQFPIEKRLGLCLLAQGLERSK